MVALLFGYWVALYILITDILRLGGAAYLNRRRGKKWVKELDYPYLIIGALGVVLSLNLNRLELVTEKMTNLDILGPLVLTTAVAIRFVKTCADVDEWNKL